MSEVMVNLQHCRALGICLFGARRWCTRYGMDFRDFRNGTMSETMLLTVDDYWAKKLISYAKENPMGVNL